MRVARFSGRTGSLDQRHAARRRRFLVTLVAVLVVLGSVGAHPPSTAIAGPAVTPPSTAAPPQGVGEDWPTYLHDSSRSSASGDTILNTANVGTLTSKWNFKTNNWVAASPAVVNNTVFIGSWDGNEYALDGSTGAVKWSAFLGLTHDPPCVPPNLGITSSAAVINGVVYVGGGDSFWYALDATSGAVLWKVFTGDNSQAGAHYNWSSPLIAGNFAYIGIASNCDAPLVQGQLLKVDLTTHQVVATAKFVPDGQVGGGVWTSPALDAASNTIFVTTGTLNLYSQTMSQAIVALDTANLVIKDSWQLPFEAAVSDSDWGTTPTLTVDGTGRQLVSATNKNGVVYTFLRGNLAAGPVWQRRIAIGGDCPPCGDGSIASAAFANGVLYVPGGSNVGPDGVGHRGSVTALDPATGRLLWYHGTNEQIIGSIAYSNGLIFDPQGTVVEALDAATGNSLWTYKINGATYAAPAISNGTVYIGGLDMQVHAFGLPANPPPAPPPDGNCPQGFTCQNIGGAFGNERVNGDGTITATAVGSGISNPDQERLITQPVTGDMQISTTIQSMSGGSFLGRAFPKTGVMVRQSSDPQSPYYAAFASPQLPRENEFQPLLIMVFRTQWGGPNEELTQTFPQPFPRGVMVQRHGDTLQTLSTGDGNNWTLLSGTTKTIVMPTTVMGGISLDSGQAFSQRQISTFTRPVVVSPPTLTTFGRQTPGGGCPQPWSCEDVGAGSPLGDQQLNNGTWTIQGQSTGIAGATDQFHYVYRKLVGDGNIIGRLTSLNNNSPTTQAGLVMRADDTSGSAYYGIVIHPNGTAAAQWRVNNNLITRPKATMPVQTLPTWYQIQRYTDTAHSPALTYYTALTSPDGTTWTQVPGSTVTLNLGDQPLAGMAGSSDDGTGRNRNPSTWDHVALSNVRIPSPGICPVGFTCQDVGGGYAPGSQTTVNNTWNLQAGGADIWDVYDQFRFASQPLAADGTVSARVVSVGAGALDYQKAGVMVRPSNDPQAPYYGIFQTPKHGIAVQWRATRAALSQQISASGPAPPYPVYLMVGRWTDPKIGGTYYTAYTSTDNKTFNAVPGSTMLLDLPGTLLAGIAADSYDEKTTLPVSFDNFALFDTEPAPPGSCPYAVFAGCADIGGATPLGLQTFANGSLTTQIGGGDIWSTADQLHLVWQNLAADGSVSARVSSQQNTGPWAKAGVMLRASVDASSPYYGFFVTPSKGMAVQYRTAVGATTSGIFVPGVAPAFLRVGRFTDAAGIQYYTAYGSGNGTDWTQIPGSTVSFAMAGSVLAGFAANAYSQAFSNTVVFDTLNVNTGSIAPGGLCPVNFTCSDVGGAIPAGAQNVNGATLTVQGGGGDIWDVADQFRLVAQAITGDATVTANVTTQQNTNGWAKAGVMMRSTTGTGSPYYSALMTPGNGVAVQWRGSQGATTGAVTVAGATPKYLRVSRWTDNAVNPTTYYSAYTSPDSVTWTLVPGSLVALALPGPLLSGVAVTSHNTSALSEVSFSGVTIATPSSKPPGLP